MALPDPCHTVEKRFSYFLDRGCIYTNAHCIISTLDIFFLLKLKDEDISRNFMQILFKHELR